MVFPEAHRYACMCCRQEYALQIVLDEAPPIITSVESAEEVLHGD